MSIHLAPLARPTDPITSDLAGETVNRVDSKTRVIQILTDCGPLADIAIVTLDGGLFSPQRLRTARCELVDEGVVRATGSTVATRRGSRVTHHNIWELT